MLIVEVNQITNCEINEVFDALVKPEKMSNYFITSGSCELVEGETIIWKWDDVGAKLLIKVIEVDLNNYSLSYKWEASGIETIVKIKLHVIDKNKTMITVTEDGWESNEIGINRYAQQLEGWVDMLNSLKVYLEFGINLRKGYYINESYNLKVDRIMNYSCSDIYRAWTDNFDKWFAESDTIYMPIKTNSVFFFETQFKSENDIEERRYHHYGRFLNLKKNKLIEMTWVNGKEGTSGAETILRVELEPLGNKTKVNLKHSGFYDRQTRDGHLRAWKDVLAYLEEKLDSI